MRIESPGDGADANAEWRDAASVTGHLPQIVSEGDVVRVVQGVKDAIDGPISRYILEIGKFIDSGGRYKLSDFIGDVVRVAHKTASYTLSKTDRVITADCTSGNVTITLPPVSGNTGRRFVVKRTDASVNNVIVAGDGSETIDGSNTYTMSTQYDSVTVLCDGTEWWTI